MEPELESTLLFTDLSKPLKCIPESLQEEPEHSPPISTQDDFIATDAHSEIPLPPSISLSPGAQPTSSSVPDPSVSPTPMPTPVPNPTLSPTPVPIPEHSLISYFDDLDQHIPHLESIPSRISSTNSAQRQPNDRVSSTEPHNKVVTTEFLQRCLGFRNIDKVIKSLPKLCAPTITVRDTGRDPVLSRGETATLPKRKRNNKSPVARDNQVYHYDIGYGNGRAIGGVHYALFIVSRQRRTKYIFGLKNLKETTIIRQLQNFVRTIGHYPAEMIADRDFKLIGEHVDTFFKGETLVSGAPSGRQSQNGLSEINWRYVCDIARNYLTENLLPSEFWFFALKYAVQVSNYLPIKTNSNTLTTPYHLEYGALPDYRKLLPLFSVAYVKNYDSAPTSTLDSQTVPCILVGNDHKSDGRLFYNPHTKQLIGSSDYRLDTAHPSGPVFGMVYDGGLQFQLYTPTAVDTPPAFRPGQQVYLPPDHPTFPSVQATVLAIPLSSSSGYTIQLSASKDIIEVEASDILPHDPSSANPGPEPNPILTLPWLQHKAKCTLYLPEQMTKPKQGYLFKEGSTWSFLSGRSLKEKSRRNNSTIFKLPDFDSGYAERLFFDKQLINGWQTHKTFLSNFNATKIQNFIARRVSFLNQNDPIFLSDDHMQSVVNDKFQSPTTVSPVCRKVSASNLKSLIEPKLHEHHLLSAQDKEIWDKAYVEEYLGLHEQTETWEYITEEEYQLLRPVVGNALPSMALSKIKRDKNGHPSRAKYRIVVLGNLDPHNWESSDCFAPVLSALELRLLVALAAQSKCIPKSGDISQAFCQATLPSNEKYIIRAPKGCPITPPRTLLLLKKTLYGLRRSPRHWYETCKAALVKIGLKPLPNSPCIFTGILIEGEPPIYLGLFVDDFIYYSKCKEVEILFEEKFGACFDVDFQGDVTHFLGLNFTCTRETDGHVSIFLNQPVDTKNLIAKAGLDSPSTITKNTPYRSGHPVDAIPHIEMSQPDRDSLNKTLQEYVGSLNWLETQSRPDIATITNMLAQYSSKCSPGHIDATKYAIRYLKGTADKGIQFSSKQNAAIESFVQFPVDPSTITPLSDSNWGPQDASPPNPNDPPVLLDLFKSRSVAGFLIWLGGPLHWKSKRQSFTARSSAEAEIGAVDECTKTIQHLENLLRDLGLFETFAPDPITIYNDNAAAVQWSHNMTTKGLRHIQMKENAVREQVQRKLINVEHIAGNLNLSDIFTKEDRDVSHYQRITDVILSDPPLLPE